MGILDKDLAFNFPYMRRFQELGIKAMEVAEETALEQEACMRRMREAIAELPPGVDTSCMDSILDRYQGTMVLPIYQETKVYLRNRIDQLIENITAIDMEAEATFIELTQRAQRISWQYHSLVHMLGKGSKDLNLSEFQIRLGQVMKLAETGDVSNYIWVEDGAFQYDWSAIGKLLDQEKISEQELSKLVEILKVLPMEGERRDGLYEELCRRMEASLPLLAGGEHSHLDVIMIELKQAAEAGWMSMEAYKKLKEEQWWYHLSKVDQEKVLVLDALEANKETLMAELGMDEEAFERMKAHHLTVVEIWAEYEGKIAGFQRLDTLEKLDRYGLNGNPETEYVFLTDPLLAEYGKEERMAMLKAIQENGGIFSKEAYEEITGKKDPWGMLSAKIEISHTSSLYNMTYGEMIQSIARAENERIEGFATGLLMALNLSYSYDKNNPKPYDGNLDPKYRMDRMELDSKNGFKSYEYVPLTGETLKWLKENYPMEGDPNFIGPVRYEGAGKLVNSADVKLDQRSIDHAFGKHSADFGNYPNGSKASVNQFTNDIKGFIDSGIQKAGTYRSTPGTHIYNSSTNQWVFINSDGTFNAAFKLSAEQLKYLIETGVVK